MEVVVRPALPGDKAPLMSFIKEVWGGHDYIPDVWDDWLDDDRGRMYVADMNGVPVAMNRVSFLEDGSAWFQGARVHPLYRGLGVATLLGENSMKIAAQRGVKVFRLTTASRNFASRRQIGRMRFMEVARFSVYEPPEGSRLTSGHVERLSKDDGDLMELLSSTEEYRLGAGVYWYSFVATSLTPEVVRRLSAEGAIWRLGNAVAIVKVGGEGSETWEQVCFVGGPAADSCRLVTAAVSRRTGARGWVFVPQKSPVIHALRRAGFRRGFSQILFERRAANG